jgi:hypothetical protein
MAMYGFPTEPGIGLCARLVVVAREALYPIGYIRSDREECGRARVCQVDCIRGGLLGTSCRLNTRRRVIGPHQVPRDGECEGMN